MKEQTTKSITSNPKSHYTENNKEHKPFFTPSISAANNEVVQKKEAPFFSKTSNNPFFKPNNNSSPNATIQPKSQPNKTTQPKDPAKTENKTGLPDQLKAGVENLSGYSMDDVKVHYNSDKPAQLQAHAYAQGSDIHLASGQEKHLPHEAWHVVQQKQGRVKPTMQMKEKVDVNDDKGLEKEADVMGARALNLNVSLHNSGSPFESNNNLNPTNFAPPDAYQHAPQQGEGISGKPSSMNGTGVQTIQRDPGDEPLVEFIRVRGNLAATAFDLLCRQVEEGQNQVRMLELFSGPVGDVEGSQVVAAKRDIRETATAVRGHLRNLPNEVRAARATALGLAGAVTIATPHELVIDWSKPLVSGYLFRD